MSIPSAHGTCSLNQWVRSLVGLFTSAGTGEYFPPLQFTCRNCGDRGRVAIYRPFGEVSLSLNRTVTCMVLKANDRRTSCPCHDEFRGPRSDYVRQDYDTSFSRVYFSRPGFFDTPPPLVPTFFPSVVARSSSLSRLLFDLLPDAGSSSLHAPPKVKFAPCG
ncbi:uncharacterized protein TNCV_4801701 [Trichonephila clavipes]|nr:uncharacterized protein TNCV_4801701 [Trichonephila clavipes]